MLAASAGVTGALVKDVLADILGPDWQGAHPRMSALLAKLDEAVEFVKAKDDKGFHDVSVRKLVEAAIALVIAALFVKLSATIDYKRAALTHWLMKEFPRVGAQLDEVLSGYNCATDENFGILADA